MPNFDFSFDREDIPGSLAKLLKYMNWFTQHLDETNIKSYAWGDSQSDNVDSLHKLKLKFYVPDGVIKVQKLLLNFSIEKFRAYETTVESGGLEYDARTIDAQWNFSATDYTIGTNDSELYSDPPETFDYGIHIHTVDIPTHFHLLEPNSTVHTHNIDFGIYESTTAANVEVYVDGVLRLSNGGSGYTSDQANLDLTQWVSTAGWHTIELSSSRLGRINAAYFIQIYAGSNGV